MTSPFKDLFVLELASVLAGPGVGQFFAELGAEVIKVENLPAGGDVTRSWKSEKEQTDDRSAYFCSVNWGKKSIALNLSKPEGRDIVHRLARRADIVITSYKPGDDQKLGVAYETLSTMNPGLIYGQITGYGTEDQRVGYDAIIQAEAGFMSMNGVPGGPSLKMPVALMDILAGHQLKEGLLVAMLEKAGTGKGKLVAVSLFDAAVTSLANQASNYLVGGQVPGKQGSAHPNIAPYGDLFISADGKEILLAIGTDRQFEHLANLLNISSSLKDMPFTSNLARVQNRATLNTLLAKAIGRLTAADFLRQCHAARIPAGQVRRVDEVVNDASVRKLILEKDDLRGIRSFAAHTGSSHLLPPPHLGEHSRIILEDLLNFSPTDIKNLFSDGIIG